MFAFRSFRSRLTVTFLAIILVVMVIISFFLYNLLQYYYLRHFQENLSRTGYLAAEFVADYLGDIQDHSRLGGLAENFSRQSRARVLFLNMEGVVVGDSVRIGGLMGEKLVREEITAALDGREQVSIQYSKQTRQKVMQVAIPVYESGIRVGAVFLSAGLNEIYQILADIQKFLLLTTLVVMFVVGGGCIILAGRFTGKIEMLTAAAAEMAEGNLQLQIPVTSKDEIGRLAKQFNIMAERLYLINRNLKDFAGNVSHELRTPLTSLSILVKSMQEYSMDPEQQSEFLLDMDRELERLINLVQDLLELTRAEHFRDAPREEFCLVALTKEIITQITPRFDRQDLRLIAEEFPSTPVRIYGSSLQMRLVIHNLLDNALKYTSPGGWVRLSISLKEGEAVIRIEDTGSGIPAEDLPHIFERFYRVDRARSRSKGGTGLGLAIAKEVVEAHRGRIRVETALGKGSAFLVCLPLYCPKLPAV